MTISFHVPGLPSTKGSARPFAFRRRDGSLGASVKNSAGDKAKAWAAKVSLAAMTAMEGRPPFDGPVSVRIVFHMPRPKGHYGKRGLKPSAPEHVTTAPDGDKMLRCTWDALTGIAFVDDAQIVEWPGSKRYAIEGRIGADITIEPVPARAA